MRKGTKNKRGRIFTSGGLALELGVSDDAVRLYERRGIIASRRTTTGVRVFGEADLAAARAYRAVHGRQRRASA